MAVGWVVDAVDVAEKVAAGDVVVLWVVAKVE